MKSSCFAPLLLVSSMGCLSLDAIPVADPHGPEAGTTTTRRDAGPEWDAGVEDAAVDPDASAADASVDATLPAEPPKCGPGVTGACLFDIEATHGTPGLPVIGGSYVYWTESGSVDTFNNYRYDGALARTKVGDWQREDFATGLDFFDEAGRLLFTPPVLASEQYVVWRTVDEWSASYTATSTASHARPLQLPVMFPYCRLTKEELFCTSNAVWRLDRDEPYSSIAPDHGGYSVFPSDASWYIPQNNRRIDGQVSQDWDVFRVDRTGGEPVAARAGAEPIDALPDGRLLAQLADQRIGIASFEAGAALRWRAITDPGKYLGSHDNWVYWRPLPGGTASPIYRSHVDGSQQQLVTDLTGVPASCGFEPSFGESGIVLTCLPEWNLVAGFLYIPFPPG